MTVNKPSMHFFLAQVFCLYDDRLEDMPELTLAGFQEDIHNMQAHARTSNELLELKVTIYYILQAEWAQVKDWIPYNHYFEEEEEIKMVLQLMLKSDWGGMEEPSNIDFQKLRFLDIPLMKWRPNRIKK